MPIIIPDGDLEGQLSNLLSTTVATMMSSTSSSYLTDVKKRCGEDMVFYDVSDDVGYVTSPNYPDAYVEDLQCQWLLRAPEGKVNVNASLV